MTSSRLSVADVAGEVPRIAARAVLAPDFSCFPVLTKVLYLSREVVECLCCKFCLYGKWCVELPFCFSKEK